MDLSSCTRSRATRRTVINKLLKALEDAIQGQDPLQVEIELEKVKVKEYDLRILHQRMEELILADPAASDDEIIANEDYADKIIQCKVVANRFLVDARKANQATIVPASAPVISSKAQIVKLPKLQIGVFKGEISDWERFWDQFSAGVDKSSTISKVDKFNYLKSLLAETAHLTIAGLSLTESNYDIALNLLKDKYGKPDVLIAEHIQQIWNTKRVSRVENGAELRLMLEKFKMHVNSLENLGQNVNSMGPIFCHVLMQALPKPLILEWNRRNIATPNTDLPKLVAFVKSEIEGLELASRTAHAQAEPSNKRDKDIRVDKYRSPQIASASSLVATETLNTSKSHSSPDKQPYCIFCNFTNHWSSSCAEFVTNQARREALRKANRCFHCFKRNHNFKECDKSVTCRTCKRRHLTMLCPSRDSAANSLAPEQGAREKRVNKVEEKVHEPKSTLVASTIARPRNKKVSVLQVISIWVRHANGLEPVTVLFDGGSERSFVTKALVDKLGLVSTQEEELVVRSFGGQQQRQPSSRVKIRLVGSNNMELTLEASQVQEICTGVTHWDTSRIESFLQGSRNFSWKQSMGVGHVSAVDILVGADWYWQAMTGHMKRLSPQLMATQSIFGWMLQGCVDAYAQNVRVVSMLCATSSEWEEVDADMELSQRLKQMWELDRAGTIAKEDLSDMTLGELEVLKNFEATTCLKQGRYQVRIPWSNQKELLGRNYTVAKERLRRLLFKLQQSPELLDRYRAGMKEYLDNGHIEEVTNQEEEATVYYMPHHPIVKESRTTTKLRIVFDASSHETAQLSLNQCQHSGPNLNPLIFDLLLRFRCHAVAITSDMEKAFLQVLLAPEDRDATRFLWTNQEWSSKSEPQLQIFRMTRVLFGMRASPFLLAATIRHHAKTVENSNPALCKVFHEDTYVDDMVSGARTVDEAYRISAEGRELMAQVGMKLVKWATNSKELRLKWKEEGIETSEEEVELLKVLGLVWNPKLDTLSYKTEELSLAAKKEKYSKRGILGIIARLYDPLGFVAPKVIQAKEILQKLWKLKVSWDEPVPEAIKEQWRDWLDDLKVLSQIQVLRCCQPNFCINQVQQLHIFSDASTRSFGSVVYLRTVQANSEISVRLVTAKARIAPVTPMSIPRLELLAALVATRLARSVKVAWNRPELPTFIWTDSKVVLYWIKGEPSDWKVFVGRRVQEIQQESAQWNYCNTKENVADLLTRGMPLKQLWTTSKWWNGPAWLSQQNESWNDAASIVPDEETQVQIQKEEVTPVVVQATVMPEPVFPVDTFESWSKTVRVTAWIKRFIQNCRKEGKNQNRFLSHEEIQRAEVVWFKHLQATEFSEELQQLKKGLAVHASSPIFRFYPQLDEQGLIRISGRLKFANLAEIIRHPILLKGEGLAQALIRNRHGQACHGGVQETLMQLRKSVWVLQGRKSVRAAIRNCYVCRKWAAKAPILAEAPLPTNRITQSRPFQCMGLDFAGPVWIKTKTEKVKGYICLFTCAVTRAVHLELVLSQEIKHFILALRRFVARRGACESIYSDNAQTLRQADRLLREAYRGLHQNAVQEQATQLQIQWNFIAPRAAWWGGLYERLVGSVKRHLRRTLGSALLEADELATVLAAIEAVINNRPLIAITEDPEDSEYLSPAHFLIGRPTEALGDLIPGIQAAACKQSLVRRWRYRKRLLQLFWRKWKEEYLLQLQSAHQVKNAAFQIPVKLGDVVLKKDDKLPRGQWKLARIVELTPGRDGLIRSVMLLLPNGQQLRRAIQHICPLEVV